MLTLGVYQFFILCFKNENKGMSLVRRSQRRNVNKRVNLGKIVLISIILILALGLRFLTLNQIGRTWDESEYIEQGYKMS